MQAPKIDFHEWELTIIFAAALAFAALTVLSELISRAKVIYMQIRNFRKPDEDSRRQTHRATEKEARTRVRSRENETAL